MILASHPTGEPDAPHTAWILHGILGSGLNWRSFARRMVDRHPDWSVRCVDLRNHGDSHGALPPHDLEHCAQDLWALAASLHERPDLLIGHSFGGKVALTHAGQAVSLGAGPEHVWVLDATPGPLAGDPRDDSEVAAVIGALTRIPQPLARREDVVGLLRDAGFSQGLAQWMTTNLRRTEQGYVWRFDLPAVQEMIADYFRQDLWPVLEHPGTDLTVDVVRAERSDRWRPAELARFAALPPDGPVRLHVLPNSGHWVHVDNPSGLLAMLEGAMGSGVP